MSSVSGPSSPITQPDRCRLLYLGPAAPRPYRWTGGWGAAPACGSGAEAGRAARPQRRLDPVQHAFDLRDLLRVEPALERRALQARDGVALAAELLDPVRQVAALRPRGQLGQ